jgi:UDP-2,3-diacylglucosamine pyrophosphatase LpxH
MLVFVSNLHFVDGTAEEHNLSYRALEYFFDDLEAIAKNASNSIKEIKLVFLVDIFDLLRTENWFAYPPDERPWGTNEHAIEIHAQTLFDDIVNYNENHEDEKHEKSRTFQRLRQRVADLPKRCKLDTEVQLFYLPGNHDRLVNRYPSLRENVCTCLGISKAQHDP